MSRLSCLKLYTKCLNTQTVERVSAVLDGKYKIVGALEAAKCAVQAHFLPQVATFLNGKLDSTVIDNNPSNIQDVHAEMTEFYALTARARADLLQNSRRRG